jgi:dolichol-phosphate mannosyltransferase
LVIIPTYNEIDNIEAIVRKVMGLAGGFHTLVVDDNSPDGTAAKVRELQSPFAERLHLLERAGKQGLGTAYIAGFRWGLAQGYDYLFEMDADFSHNPDDLPRLLEACTTGGADLSVGSRYVKGGSVADWPFLRVLMSYCASMYVQMVLWVGIKDATAGFVCYHRRVLDTLNLDAVKFVGYAFQIQMKYASVRNGFKLKEVPITFIDRRAGQSKMSMGIFKEAFLGVLKMRFNRNSWATS